MPTGQLRLPTKARSISEAPGSEIQSSVAQESAVRGSGTLRNEALGSVAHGSVAHGSVAHGSVARVSEASQSSALTQKSNQRQQKASQNSSSRRERTSPERRASSQPRRQASNSPPKNGKVAHDANIYQRIKEQRLHVLKRPDTYLGSPKRKITEQYSLNMDDEQNPYIEVVKSDLPSGMIRTYIEIISNAGDNGIVSRDNGVDPGEIQITMDETTVTVRNGGMVIPVEKHPEEIDGEEIWCPEMIMGVLMTGSNFDDDVERKGVGRNGFGAKITNIFSKQFSIEIGDPHNKKHYHQVWTENMDPKYRQDPVISDYFGQAFVEIKYRLDFARFGYKNNKYPTEAPGIYMRHASDMAITQRIPVRFNGFLFTGDNLEQMAEYYFGKDNRTLVHYQYEPGVNCRKTKQGYEVAEDPNILPDVEMILVDTPGESRIIAYTNNIANDRHGVHVDAAIEAVSQPILDLANKQIAKIFKREEEKGIRGLNLTDKNVRENLSMIIIYRAIKPGFDSQTKECLTEPRPYILIENNRFQVLKKDEWILLASLVSVYEARLSRKLQATGKAKSIKIKGKDANHAGKKGRAHKCTLVLTEGDSAAAYATHFFKHLGERWRDTTGILPLRGKLLNPRGKSDLRVMRNTEILSLIKMLGLGPGLVRGRRKTEETVDYTRPENRKHLRYGRVCIIADADVDGKHIRGLIYNLFHYYYPDLLAVKPCFVYYLKTPILRMFRGRGKTEKMLEFHSLAEHERWTEEHPEEKIGGAHGWRIQYYKGLGSSNPIDAQRDFKNPFNVQIFMDENAAANMKMLFEPGKQYRDARKTAIEGYASDPSIERVQFQAMSHMLRYDVLEFSLEDNVRSIPAMDGLKVSLRKILYTALNHFVGQNADKPFKVSRFSGKVSSDTGYHHGEASLNGAIIGMTQDYPCSGNNLNHFEPDGNFGTRLQYGKDAASPRYISAKLNWWIRLVYRAEDNLLLTQIYDEGEPCEYERYYPIIPLGMVNGGGGIGTGFSSYIPPFNPLRLIQWLLLRMVDRQQEMTELKPWWRGFTGTVEIEDLSAPDLIDEFGDAIPQPVIQEDVEAEREERMQDFAMRQAELNPDEPFDPNMAAEPIDDDPLGEDDVIFALSTYRSKGNDKRVKTTGRIRCLNKARQIYMIDELPIGYSIDSYEAWLKKMTTQRKHRRPPGRLCRWQL